MYLVVNLLYFPLLYMILVQFKVAYPDIYTSIRHRLTFFFMLQIAFISYRGFLYYQINYEMSISVSRSGKLQVYISEIFLALLMMVIAFKNMQNDLDESQSEVGDGSEIMPPSMFQVRSSFINPRRRIDSDVKQIKTTLNKQKDELQKEKRWSISNASSDFNRVGLMNSQNHGKNDQFEFNEETYLKKYTELLLKGMDKSKIEQLINDDFRKSINQELMQQEGEDMNPRKSKSLAPNDFKAMFRMSDHSKPKQKTPLTSEQRITENQRSYSGLQSSSVVQVPLPRSPLHPKSDSRKTPKESAKREKEKGTHPAYMNKLDFLMSGTDMTNQP